MKRTVTTLRQFTNSLIAGIISGVLFLGIGGRFAMRGLAMLAAKPLEFSIEGTLGILFISIVLGTVGGLLFPLVRQHLPGLHATTGGTFGLLLFVVLIPMMPAEINQEVLALGDWLPLSIAIFGLLFLCFGIVLEKLVTASTKFSAIRVGNSYVEKRVSTNSKPSTIIRSNT